ncbi:MAG: RagB/SusD family nutrient uptake outer membrane protein [Chitinophagaceae bacterium]|nr:RagB/SusD family nutrient uptake outer membrane protein [Chitinophagaceae bacterium]
MKKINHLLSILVVLVTIGSCQKVLDKEPIGVETEQNYFLDPSKAILAINAAYDVLSWDEGPGSGHNYEWMYGDVLSDDAEKGSTPGDFPTITMMKEWRTDPANNPSTSTYNNMWQGIFRTNTILKNLEVATWDQQLKKRIEGEARFLRGYYYFYLLRLFGGMPLFTEPVKPSEFGTTPRASISETYKLIEDDFKKAIELLPERSGYSAADLGRATKGSARAYLARAIMYQLGTDNKNAHTWQEVYDLTNAIVNSGQYSLIPNYAQIYEDEGENSAESVFEIQCKATSEGWGPIKAGTTNNIIQNNRRLWGWGFNNPTTSLGNEFEPNDPRKACTMYGDGSIVLGILQVVDYPNENATGYLNRKAAIVKPVEAKASPQNIRKFRYADVLLMKAEAAAFTGKEQEARDILNMIRTRARLSSLPKGSAEGSMSYDPTGAPSGTLPAIANTVTGDALKNAIYHERRVELGMEALRFWDQVRTGKYLSSLSTSIRSACQSHCITEGTVNPIPVLPIPLTEVQSWGLKQNPGY